MLNKKMKGGENMSESEAQRRANLKYRKKAYDTFLIKFRQDRTPTKEEIRQAAEKRGESLHEFIIKAIRERLQGL